MLHPFKIITCCIFLVLVHSVSAQDETLQTIENEFQNIDYEFQETGRRISRLEDLTQQAAKSISLTQQSVRHELDEIRDFFYDLQSMLKKNVDYQNFAMPFAAVGQPKNVVILKSSNDASTFYNVRVRYENSNNETIVIAGIEQQFDYMAQYINVEVDLDGNIISLDNFVEAMNDPSYSLYYTSSISYDPITLEPWLQSNMSSRQYVQRSQEGNVVNLLRNTTSYADDSVDSETSRLETYFYTLGVGYEVDTLNFAGKQYRVENRFYGNGNSNGRVRVKGIGVVELMYNSEPRQAIYYRVNGQTGGSLAGTPFASGEVLEGLFF